MTVIYRKHKFKIEELPLSFCVYEWFQNAFEIADKLTEVTGKKWRSAGCFMDYCNFYLDNEEELKELQGKEFEIKVRIYSMNYYEEGDIITDETYTLSDVADSFIKRVKKKGV